MNPTDFQNSPAGRLVQVRASAAPYWAFIPNPLPPALAPDIGLMGALSEADRALGELAGLGRTLANPHLLMRPFVRREAVASSRIEGTETDLANLYAFEAGQMPLPGLGPAPRESDAREVLNYVRALEYGLERVGSLPVSLRLMRELHARLMDGVRGEGGTPGAFRQGQNWIGPPRCTLLEAHFVPPPPAEMEAALNALETYLHSDDPCPPLIRLALVHYQFEAVHPFLDGNGRIGRLLIALLMVHWDLLPVPLLYLSGFFEHHRSQYYDLLLAISQRGAWREWVAFFLQGVAREARDAAVRAKELQDLHYVWRGRLTQARASALLPRLLDSLFDVPVLTIPRAQRLLDVTYRAAQRHMKRLVEEDIVQLVRAGPPVKVFAAREILRIASRD